MVQIDLGPEMEARLKKAAADNQVTASFFAGEAIARFLEDREDYMTGIRSLAESKSSISLEEMERRSSVAD